MKQKRTKEEDKELEMLFSDDDVNDRDAIVPAMEKSGQYSSEDFKDTIMEDVNSGTQISTECNQPSNDISLSEDVTMSEPPLMNQDYAPTRGKRGRRKVEKEVQVRDEQNFLITKYVSEWESYSEGEDDEVDEALTTKQKSSENKKPVTNRKQQPKNDSHGNNGDGSKGKSVKGGQSSLMKFFKKG